MLKIIVPEQEFFDDETQSFITFEEVKVTLQHSLLSLSKWESEFEKPFLAPEPKTQKELLGYVRHMIISPEENSNLVSRFTNQNMIAINEYIEASHSATTFGVTPKQTGRGETITSELIYYWMVAFQIPFEAETWHLNRLFALIRICNLKNQPSKKMSKNEIAMRNRELNAQRKAKLGTSG